MKKGLWLGNSRECCVIELERFVWYCLMNQISLQRTTDVWEISATDIQNDTSGWHLVDDLSVSCLRGKYFVLERLSLLYEPSCSNPVRQIWAEPCRAELLSIKCELSQADTVHSDSSVSRSEPSCLFLYNYKPNRVESLRNCEPILTEPHRFPSKGNPRRLTTASRVEPNRDVSIFHK